SATPVPPFPISKNLPPEHGARGFPHAVPPNFGIPSRRMPSASAVHCSDNAGVRPPLPTGAGFRAGSRGPCSPRRPCRLSPAPALCRWPAGGYSSPSSTDSYFRKISVIVLDHYIESGEDKSTVHHLKRSSRHGNLPERRRGDAAPPPESENLLPLIAEESPPYTSSRRKNSASRIDPLIKEPIFFSGDTPASSHPAGLPSAFCATRRVSPHCIGIAGPSIFHRDIARRDASSVPPAPNRTGERCGRAERDPCFRRWNN